MFNDDKDISKIRKYDYSVQALYNFFIYIEVKNIRLWIRFIIFGSVNSDVKKFLIEKSSIIGWIILVEDTKTRPIIE